MKKVISVLLAAALLLSLAACGTTAEGGAGAAQPAPAGSEPTGSEPTGSEPAGSDADAGTDAPAPAGDESIAEQVLVDDGTIKVTATGFARDGLFGPSLKLLVENNGTQALTVQARNVSVNGYMVQNALSVDVAAGKKANDALTLMSSDLERCGIGTVADLEFSLHVFTSEDWADYLDTDLIQLKTAAADGFAYAYDDSGEVLYEEGGIRIVSKGFAEDDSLFGPELLLYVHNDTDRFVTVQVRDVSLNGFMVTPAYSQDITPGRHALSGVTFMSSELEENGITDVTEAELTLHIFDTNTWEDIADSAPIPLTF